MKTTADATTVEQYGYQIEFQYPLIEQAWDSLSMRSVNPRQQEAKMEFVLEKDSTNLRKFSIKPTTPFQQGFDYYLKIPYRKFRDINGYYNDSTELKVTLPKDDKLSSITLNITGVRNKYIIDLLTEKRDKIIRSYIVESDGPVLFPYLKAAKYCIRITEDINRNNIVDTGNLLEHRQPEKVLFFKLEDQFLIPVLERSEMVWDLDLQEMFK